MNNHYPTAVREASLDLILGRSDNIVKVGDLVGMPLGISFAVKDAMLDWEWLGIDPVEWPPQRLDWEMYSGESRLCHTRLSPDPVSKKNNPKK